MSTVHRNSKEAYPQTDNVLNDAPSNAWWSAPARRLAYPPPVKEFAPKVNITEAQSNGTKRASFSDQNIDQQVETKVKNVLRQKPASSRNSQFAAPGIRSSMYDEMACPADSRLPPMNEDELELLEKKTETVEQQMDCLTNCVDRLSRELATEQTTNKLLRSHVNDAFLKLEQAKTRDTDRDDLLFRKQKINNARLRQFRSSQDWKQSEHPEVQQAIKEYQEVLMLLEEERLAKIELRAQYEKQLNLLRSVAEKNKIEERRKVLQEFDYVIRKYHSLAEEAAALARRERQRTEAEKLRVQKIAETACKGFERDIKDKTKSALDQYRKLAQEAHDAAKRERSELIRHCTKMESAVDKERRLFEAHVVREAEKRVAGYRTSYEKVQEQMENDRIQYQNTVDELCNAVALKCQEFEATTYSKVLEILWKNGIDMEETELCRAMATATGVPLRSAVASRSKAEVQKRLSGKEIKLITTSSPCIYGIQPVQLGTVPKSNDEVSSKISISGDTEKNQPAVEMLENEDDGGGSKQISVQQKHATKFPLTGPKLKMGLAP